MPSTLTKMHGAIRDLAYYATTKNAPRDQWLSETLHRFSPYYRIEYIVLTRSLAEPLPSYESRLPVTYRLAELGDLVRLRGAVSPSEMDRLSKRMAHGRICMLALYEDKVAAYGWATSQVDIEIDNLELRLGPGDSYLDDVYTLPAYRRQGIQMALHLRQLQYLREHDFKRAVAIVAATNTASIGLCQRFNFQEVDRLSFRRIFFKREYRYHQNKF